MILRNHTYLKVYKCWRILLILKTPTIKWLVIFFKNYFNFQRFYIVYIIIWRFLGWKLFTPSKLGETRLQKMQNGKSFFGEKHGKIALGLNFAPKIILDSHHVLVHELYTSISGCYIYHRRPVPRLNWSLGFGPEVFQPICHLIIVSSDMGECDGHPGV